MRRPFNAIVTRASLVALAAATLVGCGSGSAAEPQVLKGTVAGIPPLSAQAGIQDDRVWQVPAKDAESRVNTMTKMGASIIRVDMRWDQVALTRPNRPKDQFDAAYKWDAFDAVVDAAAKRGVRVLFTVWGTPSWAADPAVKKSLRFPDYSRRPLRAGEFGAFAYAAASRYTPHGVRDWEAWNEPNIPLFLRPQYAKRGTTWTPVSPTTYTALLRAFYINIKRIDAGARIAGMVTAPAGDQCPASCPKSANARMTPSAFLKALNAPDLRPPMTVVSHHPYPITTPRDVSFPGASYIDLYNINRFQKEVDQTYLRGKKLWLTEFGFSTQKVAEYSLNVSEAQQAQYLQDAYRRVRTNRRVVMVVWYFLQDNGAWGSGLLRLNGQAKPAAQVFSLPMGPISTKVVSTTSTTTLVGQARAARGPSKVTIQRQSGDDWIAVARVKTTRDGSFAAKLVPGATSTYRATWTGDVPSGGQETRTSWPVTVRVK